MSVRDGINYFYTEQLFLESTKKFRLRENLRLLEQPRSSHLVFFRALSLRRFFFSVNLLNFFLKLCLSKQTSLIDFLRKMM